MDEALALPTEKAAKIALRTQQIIANESGVANTIDPLAGSYFVEALTNEMEKQAEEYFDRIEELGGVIPAIRKNFFQSSSPIGGLISMLLLERKSTTEKANSFLMQSLNTI